jgi:hypothetical protein
MTLVAERGHRVNAAVREADPIATGTRIAKVLFYG